MPAFDNGIALGADGLEIDVQLSADGIPVVIHDHTLERTTDRTGPVRASPPTNSRASTPASISSSTARGRFAARASACRGSTTCWRASRRPHHHRDEGRPARAGACRRGIDQRADAVDRVCVGSFYQVSIDTSAPSTRRCHERIAAGSEVDAASLVGAVAVDQARGRMSRSRCPSLPAACAWCRRRSSGRCIAKARCCRCGSSTSEPTSFACSIGASTA